MASPTLQSRATGALMGALIGDALAVGPHWFYDLDAQHKAYGPWIDDYTDPKPGRYHDGLTAGQSSQAGWLLALTMRSLAAHGGYDEADWCARIDDEFFPQIDGTPNSGPGGYTSQSMRAAYRLRIEEGKPWGEIGGMADTTEAAERVLAIAVRYATDPARCFEFVHQNTLLTQIDDTVGAMTTAYGLLLAQLVAGAPFDEHISGKLMGLISKHHLPFHAVTIQGGRGVADGPEPQRVAGQFPSPDALLTMGSIARAAQDPDVRIEPAWKASLVYGMPCAIYHQFPAVYYLSSRFSDDFESAVLHAVNGGGQNLARALLTGALVGAMVGMEGIPQRLIDGLDRSEAYLTLAQTVGKQAAEHAS